ncbi:hypothetical protein GXM_05998 [Nostoc sphaeroides CCNUC1]|uniref:Uncharacterized protein n=1 Tax=Nostoc sphaeroides CCNUC1 TaxID=2653204 RepID=A0A5P8W782_9NOSO|nr:hypothetical protein GXM_05998 [Nostoc sphaeroides CCNUC1]
MGIGHWAWGIAQESINSSSSPASPTPTGGFLVLPYTLTPLPTPHMIAFFQKI